MSERKDYLSSSFPKARRQEAYRRLSTVAKGREQRPLLSLDEVSRRLGALEQTYVGVRPIPVDKIVGTVSRVDDFDRDFLPKRSKIQERWQQVEESWPDGDFPPIVVYEIDGRYFVVDGHHRVAIAKQRGIEMIDAEITELRSRTPLPADADVGSIIMAEQERRFMEESGLGRARPDATVEFSRPQGYIELLEHIKIHGFHLMMERGEVLSPEDIAADWYDRVYVPTIEAIRRERLDAMWPKATDADLFLWVGQRRRELFPDRPEDLDIEGTVRAAREATPRPKRRASSATRRVTNRLRRNID
ncbi:MAG TPA: ParB N-terminal domain-containing protein [Actinomycetota bacterium]|nr:ParB N-terminal domain-containing protein [Actinomycetota bacterium]